MKLKKYLFVASLIFCQIIFLFPSGTGSWAWNRHNVMTEMIMENLAWLNKFDKITVTNYSYNDNSLNPNFQILYENPEPQSAFPPPSQYVYIDIDTPIKYGFRGKALHEITTAKDILRDFSDEPDWKMDQELDLGFTQKVMGGSQGYRHMYYRGGSFHLPNIILAQGESPDRVNHFYELAKTAFKAGDVYWGFRFLARAMHYIQDLAQPFHTTQTTLAFITFSDPVEGTIQTTKNYHFAFESYLAQVLVMEKAGLKPMDYFSDLKEAYPKPIASPKELAIETASVINVKAGKFLRVCKQFFGEKYKSVKIVELNQEDFDVLLKKERGTEFHRLTKETLKRASLAAKSFLEFARKDIKELHD